MSRAMQSRPARSGRRKGARPRDDRPMPDRHPATEAALAAAWEAGAPYDRLAMMAGTSRARRQFLDALRRFETDGPPRGH